MSCRPTREILASSLLLASLPQRKRARALSHLFDFFPDLGFCLEGSYSLSLKGPGSAIYTPHSSPSCAPWVPSKMHLVTYKYTCFYIYIYTTSGHPLICTTSHRDTCLVIAKRSSSDVAHSVRSAAVAQSGPLMKLSLKLHASSASHKKRTSDAYILAVSAFAAFRTMQG